MKTKNCYLLLFVLAFLFSQGQKRGIIAEKISTKKQVLIKENSYVIITLVNDKKLRGNFRINNESSILIKGDTVYLANIYQIKKLSIPGLFVKGIGLAVAAGGIAIMVSNDGDFGDQSIAFISGLACIGIFKLGLSLDHNYINEKWDYYIAQ